MTKTFIIAAITLAAFGTASAQEAVYELPLQAVSSLSRAEVIADLQQAAEGGSLRVTELDRQAHAPVVAQRSRDEVRAETLTAAARGELRALNRESNSFDGRTGTAAHDSAGRMLAAVR